MRGAAGGVEQAAQEPGAHPHVVLGRPEIEAGSPIIAASHDAVSGRSWPTPIAP